jgi:hypothetical protein
VNVQLTAVTLVPNSACSRGSSGSTALCCMTVTAAPKAAAATTGHPCVGEAPRSPDDLETASVSAAGRACVMSTLRTTTFGR